MRIHLFITYIYITHIYIHFGKTNLKARAYIKHCMKYIFITYIYILREAIISFQAGIQTQGKYNGGYIESSILHVIHTIQSINAIYIQKAIYIRVGLPSYDFGVRFSPINLEISKNVSNPNHNFLCIIHVPLFIGLATVWHILISLC